MSDRMASQPASPNSKLLEEIYVNGTDTIIRISENAVLLTTNRTGGIQLPSNVEKTGSKTGAPGGGAEQLIEVNEDTYEDVPRMDEFNEEAEGVPTGPDRVVTDEELRALANNIDDDWRTLALCKLNVPATDVESIIRQTSKLPDQKFCMLRSWKTRLEQDATVQKLIAAIDEHVGKDKWRFLVGDEEGEKEEAEERRLGEYDELQHDEPPWVLGEQDEDARSTSSSIDPENLPPISLASGEHVTPESEDVQLQENRGDEAAGLEDHNDENMEQEEHQGLRDDERHEEGVLEDIERVSAVYTGFAEDKKDYFTSIGASVGDVMKKILTLDHDNKKLKTEIKRLKVMAKPTVDSSPAQPRQEDAATSMEAECARDNDGKHRCEDFKKLRHNYVKIKTHLKEAVEANREWETFCRNKRDKHEKDLTEKNEIIKALQEKLATAESSSSDANRQLDSILNDTENQASELRNELDTVKAENKELKKERHQLVEEKRKVEKLSRELMRGLEKSPSKETKRADRPARHEVRTPSSFEQSYLVLEQAKTKAKAPPPREEKRKPRPILPTAAADDDDIAFLKAQILQYRDDFEKEREDRQKAASELESLRKELERTQLRLVQQRPEEYYGGAGGYGGDRREMKDAKKKGFPYMGPEEVEQFRSQPTEDGEFWLH